MEKREKENGKKETMTLKHLTTRTCTNFTAPVPLDEIRKGRARKQSLEPRSFDGEENTSEKKKKPDITGKDGRKKHPVRQMN